MDSVSQILDIAERRMRIAGYNSVSFRDIAGEMGIKSASLHYHFPKKEDLGTALVKRYSEKFSEKLAVKLDQGASPAEEILALTNVLREELVDEKLVCLCAMLGAEAPGLPSSVVDEVRIFFDKSIIWLEKRYAALNFSNSIGMAKASFSMLEGSMITSLVCEDIGIFDAVIDNIRNQIEINRS